MSMRILKETEDRRGKIIWLVSDGKEIHVVDTKKGFPEAAITTRLAARTCLFQAR